MVRHTPLGRIGAPEDIAACCAYIVAEEASFLTGPGTLSEWRTPHIRAGTIRRQ
jgi:hypothetical protein